LAKLKMTTSLRQSLTTAAGGVTFANQMVGPANGKRKSHP